MKFAFDMRGPAHGGGHAVHEDKEGNLVHVSKRSDGSYYGQHPKYDFSAANESELKDKLKRYKISEKPVGWEK